MATYKQCKNIERTMVETLRDPYIITTAGAVVGGVLILVGAAKIQDGKAIKGSLILAASVAILFTTYYLAIEAMSEIMRG